MEITDSNSYLGGSQRWHSFVIKLWRKSEFLSKELSGWTKELNLISWNGREPKYDLRDWDPEHEKMGKGVTLTEEELKKLKELLGEMEL